MKLLDLIKIFNLKKISIFSVLLIMFSTIPNCVLAEEEATQPSLPKEDFDTMQSRMNESVDRMIEALDNSTEELDADTLKSAEEMKNNLTSIKEEISAAETESDLQTIREKFDALLKDAPEELKNISGFGMGPGPGQDQNGSQVPPHSGNMSEGRPQMPERANSMGENATDKNLSMEKQGMPGKAPSEQGDNAKSSNKEASGETGFFEKLINSLKYLFS